MTHTQYDIPHRRPAILAALAASVLMLVLGLAYQVVAARLAAPADTTPIDPAVLAQFPMQIGAWMGEEVPLAPEIVRATDTDAHINRRYSRGGGFESVVFYVAAGVQARDLMPHRPEVCYTGSGWTLANRRSMDLPLDDGTSLPCNVLQFSRGALNMERIVVLNYYLVDGQYSADVSLLRSRAWRGAGTVGYVAQVQVVASLTALMGGDVAERAVSDFAAESARAIAEIFERTQEDNGSREGGDS
jgi:EpsI family protein